MGDLISGIACGCIAGFCYWIVLGFVRSRGSWKTEDKRLIIVFVVMPLFYGSLFAYGSVTVLAEFLSISPILLIVDGLVGVLIVFSLICVVSVLIVIASGIRRPPQRQPRRPNHQKRKRKPKWKGYPVKRKNDWL